MKLIILVFLFPLFLFAQVNPKLRAAHEIYWCGLDFSGAKMIGFKAFKNNMPEVMDNIHSKWNDVIFGEPDKFNLKDLHKHKATIAYREVTDELNKNVDRAGLITDGNYELVFEEIRKILLTYPKKEPGTVGLTFIVESFDGLKKRSNVWVVFFDMYTQEPIIAEKYVGKPGGKGILNSWANSFEDVVDKTIRAFYYYK